MAAGPGGATVFVTGGAGGDDVTVAYNAATGAQRWAIRYSGPASALDEAASLAVSPDGAAVFVTGTSQGDYGTVAYNAATGAQLWASRYSGPSNDSASSVAVSPDGATVFVTGASRAPDRHHLGPGLRHGRLQRRHRRPAVGQPLQRARQQR